MPKTIEKKEIINISEGKCTRVETRISDDGKSIEFTLFCEVKTHAELIAEEEERTRREAEARAKEREEEERREAEARKREEAEKIARREAEANLKKEAEEKTDHNIIDETENIEPTIDEYMAALRRTDEALKSLKEEERKFKERMHKEAIPPQDLPIYWKKYSEACHEEYQLSEKVVYCGKKAIHWNRHGFKNKRKNWTLLETWIGFVGKNLSDSKVYLQRKITWVGTLEEYVSKHGIYITSSRYTNNLQAFSGIATKNIPEPALKSDSLEVEIVN